MEGRKKRLRDCRKNGLHSLRNLAMAAQERFAKERRERTAVVRREDMSEWINATERMPEEAYGCLVVVDDEEPVTGAQFLSILPYFVGWDGDRWNDYDGNQCPFEVRYWIPLPNVPDED